MPLIIAAQYGAVEIARLLLEASADHSLQNTSGMTAPRSEAAVPKYRITTSLWGFLVVGNESRFLNSITGFAEMDLFMSSCRRLLGHPELLQTESDYEFS